MPTFQVVTEKGTFVLEKENAARASQAARGKTLSVTELAHADVVLSDGSALVHKTASDEVEVPLAICPPDCAIDHDAVWRESREPEQALPSSLEALAGYSGPAPTQKQLERHAKLYGPGGVVEVAELYGVTISPKVANMLDPASEKKKKLKRAKSKPRKVQAQELLEQGHSWQVIEEILDLPASVSKKLQSDLNAYG